MTDASQRQNGDSVDAPLLRNAVQAAARLGAGVKVSWLKEQARRRRIPFTMVGGQYMFSEAHVQEIIRQFEQAPSRAAQTGVQPSPVRRNRIVENQAAELPPGATPLRTNPPKRRRSA